MPQTTVSLVCYNNDLHDLAPLLQSLMENPSVSAWVIVDNSAVENPAHGKQLLELTHHCGGIYFSSPRNVGFGAGHNLALKALQSISSDFHLILNPDIDFGHSVLPALVEVMGDHPGVGLIMPRVLYPNRTTQYLCKLLPTPLDFALRRFAPTILQRFTDHRMARYELRNMDYTRPGEVPFLSGCFMFARRSMLESLGGFDERYFLYMEDVDLCRRFSVIAKLLYWPHVSITHIHQRGSHKSLRLTLIHIRSAILYFNRWGWILDTTRDRINKDAMARLLK